MKKATPIPTAMAILAVFLCLAIPHKLCLSCQDCQCFSDNTCSTEECSVSLTSNCTRNEFTPTCTGTYSILTRTYCSGGGTTCTYCYSCANIYKISGNEEVWSELHPEGWRESPRSVSLGGMEKGSQDVRSETQVFGGV